MKKEAHFTLTVVHFDKGDNLVEWKFSATNGRFRGEIMFYSRPDLAHEIAEQIQGFPKSLQDKRELHFQGVGSPFKSSDREEIRILLSHEKASHGIGKCSMRTHYTDESARFIFEFTATEVDDFVKRCESFVVQDGAQLEFGETNLEQDAI